MIERVLGEEIPISISTAIPFEEQIMKADSQVENLLINVRTLFRNFYGTWSNKDRPHYSNYKTAFVDEVNYIKSLCYNQKINLVLYLPEHKHIHTRFTSAKLFEAKTKGQVDYVEAEKYTIMALLQEVTGIVPTESKIPFTGPKAHVITSYPTDLVNDTIPRLYLLESHTGVIKEKYEWMSKLTKADNVQHFPFNLFTIQVFGDKSVLFHSMNGKLKNTVVALGLKKTWTIMTTLRDIRKDVLTIEDKDIRELALRLLRDSRT